MATDWMKLAREKAATHMPDVESGDGSALSCALALVRAGFGLAEKGGRLSVTHPGGLRLSDAQKQDVARHKDLILTLVRGYPAPQGDLLGWSALWAVELDAIRRVAACATKAENRDAALALAAELEAVGERDIGEAEWKDLCGRVAKLVGRLEGSGDFPQPEKLTPWRGWVRVGGKGEEWRQTEVLADTWEAAWHALARLKVEGRSIEQLVMPEGKHPDKRRKPT